MIPVNYDPERPLPWDPGGFSPTLQKQQAEGSAMSEVPANSKCRYCGGSLAKLHGLTPRGTALGWFLRGKGPWCYWHNLDAWQAWKRGLYYGKTALNGW